MGHEDGKYSVSISAALISSNEMQIIKLYEYQMLTFYDQMKYTKF